MAKRRRGNFAAYSKYRYGARPSTEIKPAQILQGDLREATIDAIMDRLRDWRFSSFEYEGECVAEARSELCLDGHSWHAANAEAEALVFAALKKIGARRPTWEEAQSQYVLTEAQCHWCMMEIPDLTRRRYRGFLYCSAICARLAMKHSSRAEVTKGDLGYQRLVKVINSLESEARPCANCQTLFHPMPGARHNIYCTTACAHQARRRQADRQCKHCGIEFRPRKLGSEFCSKSCARQHTIGALPVVSCARCGSEFKQTSESAKYCSTFCARVVNMEHAKRRLCEIRGIEYVPVGTRFVKSCDECGKEFASVHNRARFCGTACGDKARHRTMRERKRSATVITLTARVFDRWFREAA